jgi:hypothetical protein
MYHRYSFAHVCRDSEVIYTWRRVTQLVQRCTLRRKLGKKYSCDLDAPHPSCPLPSPPSGARVVPQDKFKIMPPEKAGLLIPGSPPRSGPVSPAHDDYVTVSNMSMSAWALLCTLSSPTIHLPTSH